MSTESMSLAILGAGIFRKVMKLLFIRVLGSIVDRLAFLKRIKYKGLLHWCVRFVSDRVNNN